ncbi:MAG: hypothetical protein JKY46_06005 [Robiginitomaculum sp.]|nr:hypothetical protein [Robiginitomaculum sp.]
MRSLKLFSGLVLLPLSAIAAPPAIADGGEFCLTGAIAGSEQSINCASSWLAVDGTRLGSMPDPRNTPRTPYRPPGAVWSGSSASSATYSSGSTITSAPVWQPPIAPQYPTHTNTVTHGSYYQQPTITHNNWPTANHVPSSSCAPINPTCSSQQTTYRSHNITNGCFSYDNNGQAHSVPCPAQVTHANTWNHNQQHVGCGGVAVIAYTSQARAQIAIVHSDSFFNTLNGGVGGSSNVYYGGGGGAFISGGSSRVFSQAPLLRMPRKNIGNRPPPNKKGHGGGKKGGSHGGHK